MLIFFLMEIRSMFMLWNVCMLVLLLLLVGCVSSGDFVVDIGFIVGV